VPLHRLFDYLPPDHAPLPGPGARVLAPFGHRRLIGIVIETGTSSVEDPATLRRLAATLDDTLIDPDLLELLRWTTRYYAAAPGELVGMALPGAMRRERAPSAGPLPDWLRLTAAGRAQNFARAPRRRNAAQLLEHGPEQRARLLESGISGAVLREMRTRGWIEPCDAPPRSPEPGPELNRDQRRALATILAARQHFATILLAGVTGSGKTEVYLQAARHLLRRGRQVLVLVPEIGLTPQFVRRLEHRLGQQARVYHSGLAEGERCATWQAARDGRARLLVGTRSAVFLPLRHAGLIVVDEEHDSSFKQFDGLRYHARDVAVMRASRLGIPVVLGSATPSLESLANADAGRYRLVLLPDRAGSAQQPDWKIEDLRGQSLSEGLSPALLERIETTLEQGRQVLIYRNRRGYAPVLTCNECGWHGECSECSANLTWHRNPARLVCHHCGRTQALPRRCPDCGAPALQPVGAGTERLEAALQQRFPDIRVLRFDRDAVRGKDAFEHHLAQVDPDRPCILVGTQMLAKGHHLPGIALAVMLDADQLLYSSDFRAPERLAQTVVQVAGRSGRVDPGVFVLQTRHPEHPLLLQICKGNYLEVARALLRERNQAGLPPLRPLTMIRAESRVATDAAALLRQAAAGIAGGAIEVHGPVESLLQRRAGYWRYQLWLIAPDRATMQRAIRDLPTHIETLRPAARLRWHIDVDPLEL